MRLFFLSFFLIVNTVWSCLDSLCQDSGCMSLGYLFEVLRKVMGVIDDRDKLLCSRSQLWELENRVT